MLRVCTFIITTIPNPLFYLDIHLDDTLCIKKHIVNEVYV